MENLIDRQLSCSADTLVVSYSDGAENLALDKSSRAQTRRTSLGTAFVVFYAASALLLLALPGAVSNWLDEFEPNPIVQAAKDVVEPIAIFSDYVGASDVYNKIRGTFLSVSRRRTGGVDRLSFR
jgi:hypothetical protein